MANKPQLRPNQDTDSHIPESPTVDPIAKREPRGVQKDIANADEKARAESGKKEPVRNTPPAGDWNDTLPPDR